MICVLNSPVIYIQMEKLIEIIELELVLALFILIRTILPLAEKLLTVQTIAAVVVLLMLSQQQLSEMITAQNLGDVQVIPLIRMENTIMAAVPKRIMVDDNEVVYLNLRLATKVEMQFQSDGELHSTETTVLQRPLQSLLLDILASSTDERLLNVAAEAAEANSANAALLLALRGQKVELVGTYSDKFGKTTFSVTFK